MQDVRALVWVGVCVLMCMVPLLLLQVSIFCVLNISLQCRWLLISTCICNNPCVCTVKNMERLFDVLLCFPSTKLLQHPLPSDNAHTAQKDQGRRSLKYFTPCKYHYLHAVVYNLLLEPAAKNLQCYEKFLFLFLHVTFSFT